ncbi:UDP-N-acetylmuramate--L-alanine ligase [Chakrabartyella piscis]|uniref:UDP-N-acetylmuramate--L-alanine ligase n=1 Tax=Chakrabartyella piscis TaxID=2918914 RepID=UPI002958DCEF|nr:UDP-N-acetylmuramate--L-alanine ligase [Chakrabartyella piscis]
MQTTFQTTDHIYFIGIGGISMSGLAEILSNRGFTVSGSDMKTSQTVEHLQNQGIVVHIGQKRGNITPSVTQVIYTAAISETNPEWLEAKELGIPMMERAEFLGQLMSEYANSVAVAGTHGKTTTTSMVAEILLAAKTDPTITVGGMLPTIGSNLRIGNSSYFVAEACEYHNSFLHLSPYVGIVLNVEADHLDFFGTLEHIYESFQKFGKKIQTKGVLLVNQTISNLHFLIDNLDCTVEIFGTANGADWVAKNIVHNPDGGNTFDVYYHNEFVTSVLLHVPGMHNIENALASIGAAHYLGIAPEVYTKGLEHFHGTDRRFQYKGEKDGVLVIDDYAHHPTELSVTLAAAKTREKNRIFCVFQPHTFSRTKFLFDEFANAFGDADEVIIAKIYAAREVDDGSISGADLAEAIAKTGKSARYFETFDEISDYVKEHCKAGDMLLTAGAGDVYLIGEEYLK